MTNRKTYLHGGIEFTPKMNAPDGRHVLNGKYVMPCGCVITHDVVRSPDNNPSYDAKSEDILVYWFEDRVPWHDCNRVSMNTPSGAIPKDQRNGRKAPYAYLLEQTPQNHPTDQKLNMNMNHIQSPRTDEWMPYQKGQAAKAETTSGEQFGAMVIQQAFEQAIPPVGAVEPYLADGKTLSGGSTTVAPSLTTMLDAATTRHTSGDPIQLKDSTMGYSYRSPHRTDDEIFEQRIIDKGKTAPRVTLDDIKANIVSEWYFTGEDGVIGAAAPKQPSGADQYVYASVAYNCEAAPELALLTFCVLVLRNGFTVTGESACTSPENFDAELGRKIARENAKQKLWPLMGYELKQRLNQGPAK